MLWFAIWFNAIISMGNLAAGSIYSRPINTWVGVVNGCIAVFLFCAWAYFRVSDRRKMARH